MQRLNNTSLRVTLYFIAIFLTYVVWLYTEKIGPFWVSRDQFQFLRLIEAHFNGTLGWQDFFTSHSEHVKPFYLFGFYLNALFFRLDLRIEFYLGLIALLMSALMLIKRYLLSIESTAPNKFVFFSSIAILMQIFSFNQYASYGFSQLMFGGYVQTLLFVCIFIASDDLWLRKPKVGQLLLVSSLIVFATFSFAGARMPVLLLALVSVPVILFFYSSQSNKPNVKYALVILCVGIVSLFFYQKLSVTPQRGGDHSIERLLSNPEEVWMFFSGAIAASVLPVGFFRSLGWNNVHFASVGTSLLLIYACVVIAYVKNKLWKITLIPLMMIAYGLVFVLAVTIARYGSGFPINTAFAPRYVFDTHISFIGAMWMFFLYYSNCKKDGAAEYVLSVRTLLVAVMLVVFTLQLSVFGYEWKRIKYRHKAWNNVEVIMNAQAVNPEHDVGWPRWYCPGDKLCADGVQTLKKHSLNVFRSSQEDNETL